jgi:ribonuclease Z
MIGLVRTLGLQGREEPLRLYGPRGAKQVLTNALLLGVEKVPFGVEIQEVKPGAVIGERKGFGITAFATDHGAGSIGYALVEAERYGKFDPAKARALEIPEGPLWGKLQRGEAVELADGRTLTAESVVGPRRPGRKVVITGDTAPCASVVDAAAGADLLVHEATFGEEEKDRAKETFHSTARDAAQVAKAAQVRKLVLTHLSARYSISAEELVKEAKEVFPEVLAAKDGLVMEVQFADT